MRLEGGERELAERHRMIDELIVVLRPILAESVTLRATRLGKCRRDAPIPVGSAGGLADVDDAWHVLVAERGEKDARAVEKAGCVIEMRRSHRHVPRVDLV